MWAHPSKAGRALFHGKQACSWNAASSAGSSKESAPYRSLSLAQRQIQVERVKCNTTVVYKSPQSSKAGAVTIKWKVRGDSGTCIHFAKPPTRWRPVERTLRFTLNSNRSSFAGLRELIYDCVLRFTLVITFSLLPIQVIDLSECTE